MNSTKTKSKQFVNLEGKAIGGIAFVPEDGFFRIYVAWEWDEQASNGFFAVVKSTKTYKNVASAHVEHVADYGTDITDTDEAKRLFPYLFK